VTTPPPDLLARARLFTIAFALVAVVGLAVAVAIPLALPGPRLLTIAAGSCCFILILVAGSRLLRRALRLR
jgi:uncharacterized membrane protein